MIAMRKFMIGLLIGMSCWASSTWAQDKGTVGISMPTLASQRWVVEGLSMTRHLDKLGYRSDLQYANDDVALQISQIEGMLKKGVKALVIGAIDGTKLAPVLKTAADQKVKIISYDRLIRGSAHVDYYATFDNFQVGVLQGTDIVKRLGIASGKGPLRIELFGGSSDDNNAFFFYDGAMSVLKPYIDRGQLVVGSGQTGMDNVATLRWSGSLAKTRMVNILGRHYGKQRLDAVLSPYDGMSIEIITALKNVGYGPGGFPMPVVTGQDAEIASIRSIIRNEQASTIFKDTRNLAEVTATMVDAVLTGKKPKINDDKTYNNGEKIVPAFLLPPVTVDLSNWRGLLVDTGYYKATQFR